MSLAGNVRDRFGYTKKILRRLVLYPRAWTHRRLQRRLIVIGVTGSAGKTTTKDICSAMLGEFGATVSSFKTQNYRISAAETLLSAASKHRYCVLELSEDKPGALDLPISMARPDIGIVTIIGRDHYSAFKSEEAIAAEQGKLIHRLPESGVAVLNTDDPRVREIGESATRPVIWVGRESRATIRLLEAESRWPEPLRMKVRFADNEYQVETQLHGDYLALPVLCALGTAVALEIPMSDAIAAIRKAEPVEGRMQVIEVEGVHFLRDDWKAPHWSLDLPFEFVAKADAERKVVVIGSVSDSKLSPSKRYTRIATRLRDFADEAIFIGPNAPKALKARTGPDDIFIQAFDDIANASAYLNSTLRRGDLVLLKGTNLQDHLVRLVHNFRAPISCWRDFCGKNEFCDSCELLYKPNSASPAVHGIPISRYGSRRKPRDQLMLSDMGAMLIVGLGNPGADYSNTPHNLGFATVEALADDYGAAWEKTIGGWSCKIDTENTSLILFKAESAMNLSGEKLGGFLEHSSQPICVCVLIHDDMDLPVGECRLKSGPGHGGHKGVLSINREIGSKGLVRLKIGGRVPGKSGPAADLVLRKFSKQDLALVEQGVSRALRELHSHLQTMSTRT